MVTLAGAPIRVPVVSTGPLERRALLGLVHPEDLPGVETSFEESVRGRSAIVAEFRVARSDLKDQWIWIHGTPAMDGLSFSGVALDVTERKRSQHELLANEKLYRSIVETVAEAICIVDPNGRIVFANTPAVTLSGYTMDEILSREIFDAVFPEDLAAAHERFARRKQGEADRYDLRVRRKDGTAVWVDVSSTPMLDEAGRFVGSLIIGMNITERKMAEVELARQREALERFNADLQQFAYVTSHDLQEPLRAINSYAQLLTQRYEKVFDVAAREFVSFITGSVQRMDRLIRDLLAYSHVVNQEAPPREQIAMKGLVQWAMMNLQHSILASKAVIRFGELPTVSGDPTELAQLFQNLISNALKYRGPDPPSIEISATPVGEHEWQVSVRDNGIGIAADYHERIFGLFKRLHGQEYPGTGLGLAICKRIVEKHGGRIWVESAPECGATFHFTLPS